MHGSWTRCRKNGAKARRVRWAALGTAVLALAAPSIPAAGLLDDDDPETAIRREAEEGEDIDVLELAFADALAMTVDGRIADAKTTMLLQWAALHGPFAGA